MLSKLTEDNYGRTFISNDTLCSTLEQSTLLTDQSNENRCLQERLKNCEFCQSVFPDSLLEQHVQICDRKKVHRCSTCNKVFSVLSKLLVHQLSHSEERLHSCKVCEMAFKFESGLRRHIKQQHPGTETNAFDASLCRELQGMEYDSLQNDEQRNVEKEYLTRTDDETSRLEEYGSLQEDLNHQNSSGHCEMLGHESNFETIKDNDIKASSRISSEGFPNPLASLTIQNCVENKVDKCHRNCHSDEKLFTCEICQQTFKYKGTLSRHIREQHYGQGRKSLNSTLDAKQRNKEESYFSVGGSRFDRYLTDITEANDGVFRHWKDRHYTQRGSNSSLQTSNGGKAKCLDKRLEQPDVIPRSFSKALDETEINKLKNCSSQEKNEFQNDESLKRKRRNEEISNEDDNDSSMVSYKRQDEKTSTLMNKSCRGNGKNNSDTEEYQKQEQERQIMMSTVKQEDTKSLSSQSEENFDDVNTRECKTLQYEENDFEDKNLDLEETNLSMVFQRDKDTENCKFDENDFESSKSEKSDFSNRERNLEKYSLERDENIFEVTSTARQSFNGNFTMLSNKMRNRREDKIFQCDVCQKVFIKRSTWSNHKRTHNDDMSFACDICGKYFKYKGSLSRHVKEQHYGLGRKDQGYQYNISKSPPVRDNLHKEDKKFGPNMNEVASETPGNNNCFSSNEEYNVSIEESKTGTNLNQPANKENDLNARTAAFDKTTTSDRSCISVLRSAVNDSKAHSEGNNFAVERHAETNVLEEKCSDLKHNEQNTDETGVVNLYVNKKDDDFKNGLHNAEQDERMSDRKSDGLDDKIQNSPLEITCKICGRFFKHKGSLSRHVKEQHYGLGRKSLNNNCENQFDNSTADMIREGGWCVVGNSASGMASFDNDANENNYSSLVETSSPNMIIKLEKTVNNVDSFGKEMIEPKQSNFEAKVDEASEKNEDGQSFEERDFQLKETNERNHVLRPRDDLNDHVLPGLNESDQELFSENQGDVELGEKYKKSKVFGCNECPKVFPNRALLKKHKRVHCDDMAFTCDICQRTFKYKGSLNRHVKEQHYGMGRKGNRNMFDEGTGGNNGCLSVGNVCNPESTDYNNDDYNERNFEKENLESSERQLVEEQAGCSYSNSISSKNTNLCAQELGEFGYNLKDREVTNFDTVNSAHEDSLDLAKSKMNKEQDVEAKQSEFDSYGVLLFGKIKMHKCPNCPKSFWNVSELHEHSYKHTDIRFFACELCPKAFKFRSGLVRHRRKEHKKFDMVQSENTSCDSEEHAALENEKRRRFETVDCSLLCGENEHLKRKFSEDKGDYKNVVSGRLRTDKSCEKNALRNEELGSEFDKDVESNELIKRRSCTGETSADDCLHFESRETALKNEDHSSCFEQDVDVNGFRTRVFCVEKDEIRTRNSTNEKFSRPNSTVKRKPASYNCNKCEAIFKQLCDFLTHQSIHK